MYTIIVLFFLIWYGFVLVISMGWIKSERLSRQIPAAGPPLRVSVVIPLRNEAPNLPFLFQDLVQQQQPAHQVILVDDHSEDESAAVCRKFAVQHSNVQFIQLPAGKEGKKAALEAGMAVATGEVILTTDADCRLPVWWTSVMAACFHSINIQFVAGPVCLAPRTFLARLLALEQLALQAVTAATLAFNRPVFCNGANLGFRRQVFHEAGGYAANQHVPSGDDVFLMQHIQACFPHSLTYCAVARAAVLTQAPESLPELLRQRIRWTGKWRAMQPLTAALAIFVFTFQVVVLALPVLAMNWFITLPAVLTLMLVKGLLEGWLLHRVSKHLGLSFSVSDFLLAQFLYPPYAVTTGILAGRKKTLWKGRTVNTR